MKANFVGKWKIAVIVTLVVLVVGMVFLGIFGLNNGVEYNKVNQLKVSINQEIGGSSQKAKDVTLKYFAENNISLYENGKQTLDEGLINVYEIKSGEVDVAQLKNDIETEINNTFIEVEVSLKEMNVVKNSQLLSIILVLCISAVVIMLYLFLTEKIKASLSIVITGILNALLFLSIVSITRISAMPFVGIGIVASFIVSCIFGSVLANRFNEEIKKENKNVVEIANVSAKASLFRILFIAVCLILLGVLVAVLGKGYFLNLGLQFVYISILSCLTSLFINPALWVALTGKKLKNKEYTTEKTKE